MAGLSTPTALSWKDLSDIVCSTANHTDIEAVIAKLKATSVDGGLDLPTPDSADGLTSADIDEMGNAVPVWVQRALLKRLVRAAVARHTTPEDGGQSPSSSSVSPGQARPAGEPGTVEFPPGPPFKKTVDISSLLVEGGLQGTPQLGLAPAPLFERLAEAAEVARKNAKKPHTFVELTSKDILPEWIPPEAVGGKLPVPCETAEESTGTLAQVATALKAATTAPRFFRTYQQWLGSWNRYGVAAISTKHMCVVSVLGHAQTIARISEERRGVEHHHVALSVQYDELRRRNWEARAARGDPDLNIRTESWSIDREILDLAKARLEQVVVNAGLRHRKEKAGQGQATQVTSESALAKQATSIEAATKKAEATMNRLSNANQNSSNGNSGYGKSGSEKGGGKSWSNKPNRYQPYSNGGKARR